MYIYIYIVCIYIYIYIVYIYIYIYVCIHGLILQKKRVMNSLPTAMHIRLTVFTPSSISKTLTGTTGVRSIFDAPKMLGKCWENAGKTWACCFSLCKCWENPIPSTDFIEYSPKFSAAPKNVGHHQKYRQVRPKESTGQCLLVQLSWDPRLFQTQHHLL